MYFSILVLDMNNTFDKVASDGEGNINPEKYVIRFHKNKQIFNN